MVICTWLVELKLKTLNEFRASKINVSQTSEDDADELDPKEKELMRKTILKGIKSNF
jgi:hypothetical protein